ncbi:MAG: hypothetical protein ACQEP9_07770 [Bacillota bacterium]
MSRAKSLLNNEKIIGDSSFYEDKDGILDKIDDRIVSLNIKNLSEIEAENVEVEWQIHIPSIRAPMDEIRLKFYNEDEKIPYYGLLLKDEIKINKIKSLQDLNFQLFILV